VAFGWTCEDYEFFWRLSRHGLGALIEAPSMLYRVDAHDQLTNSQLLLYLARGNLVTLQRRLQHNPEQIGLPMSTIRHRLANAHFWIAKEELVGNAGTRGKAASHFWKSLCLDPFHKKGLAKFLFRLIFPKSVFALAQSVKRRLKKTVAAHLVAGGLLDTEFMNTTGELCGTIDFAVPDLSLLFSISAQLIIG
jgi:hypothetical protein